MSGLGLFQRLMQGIDFCISSNKLGESSCHSSLEASADATSSIRRRLQATVARGLTKFVGRDTEINALHQALKQAEAGHGQVVAAVGEAGVGKSRLLYEFIHSHRTQAWL